MIISTNCEQKLQIYYYYVHHKSEAQNQNYRKMIPVLIPNFSNIEVNGFRGKIFIHHMTCVKLFRFEGCVDILVATQFRPCDESFGRLQLCNRPFYSCRLSDRASEWQRGWSWPCFDTDLTAFIVQIKFLC